MTTPIILYDIPSKKGVCWSPNAWRARLVLNYKGLDYRTEWIEYPDIAPKLKEWGVAPNTAPDDTPYTLPAARFDDGAVVMDSRAIAREIERRFPDRPLHMDERHVPEVDELTRGMAMPLAPLWMSSVPEELLNPASAEYFHRTRSARLGMPLAQFRARFDERHWQRARESIEGWRRILEEDPSGPFVMGRTPSFGDFCMVCQLQFYKQLGQGLYEGAVEPGDALDRLYQACQPYLERST